MTDSVISDQSHNNVRCFLAVVLRNNIDLRKFVIAVYQNSIKILSNAYLLCRKRSGTVPKLIRNSIIKPTSKSLQLQYTIQLSLDKAVCKDVQQTVIDLPSDSTWSSRICGQFYNVSIGSLSGHRLISDWLHFVESVRCGDRCRPLFNAKNTNGIKIRLRTELSGLIRL